jgi:predicted type IV restriction endonuclease
MASKMEEASERMWQLVNDPLVARLQEANEAETRLLVVDRVLNILGWPLEDYKPEEAVAGGGFTDYRLTIDGQQRLIVEAKRIGRILALPKTLKSNQYSNSFLMKSCGEEVTALLDQCLTYCQRCGLRYAVATTGQVWIVLVGFLDGLEWGNLHSYVFHSLEDAANRFSVFYDLISRDAVKNNSLDERFGSAVLVRPSVAIRPRDQVEIPEETISVPHRAEVTAFFDTFMGDLTRAERAEMLERCYVSSREIEEFSSDLQALLEYDAVLDEQEKPVARIDEDQLRKAIEYQWNTGIPKTILIAGRIGAGKSTFVRRFVAEQAAAKNTACVVVDLINRAARRADQTEKEVQAISEIILNLLFERFREKFDPFTPSVLRACFRKEIDQFRSRRQVLLRQKEEEYLLAEEEYLHGLCADKYKHLVGYAQFLRNKRYKLWIALDNIDQGTYSYQEFVYAFAHDLSTESGSVTLITLREDTFLEAVEAGFLNVRSSDVVFRLNPPELRQVVAKRRRYVDYLLKYNKIPRVLGLSAPFVGALSWHLKALFLGQDDRLRRQVSSMSLGNIRDSLQLIEDYYTSFHSRFHGFYKQYAEIDETD